MTKSNLCLLSKVIHMYKDFKLLTKYLIYLFFLILLLVVKLILVFFTSTCAKDEHHDNFIYVVYLVEVFGIFDVVVVHRVIISLFLKKTSSLLPSDASGMRFFFFPFF